MASTKGPIKTENLLKWFCKNRNNIVIPNIQRDFEWNKKKIEDLFDSINRGYFIGLFFTWDFSNPKNTYKQLEKLGYWVLPTRFKKTKEKTREIEEKIKFAILDGQQRLSALNIGMFGTYEGESLYFNTKNGIFKFKKENDKKDQHLWEKVSEIRDEIEKGKITRKRGQERKTQFKNNLKSAIIARFPLTGDIVEVTEIFKRINISGTRLSPNHVLLAKLMSIWKEKGARRNIEQLKNSFRDKYQIFIDYSFIIQAALFLTDKSLRKKNDFSDADIKDIMDNWEKIEKSILQMGKCVHHSGFSSQNISTLNALLPIAYIIYNNKKNEYQNENILQRYLYTSFFKQIFAKSTDDVLTAIRKELQDNGYSLEKLLKNHKKFKIHYKRDIENILNSKYGQGKYVFMALSILYPERIKYASPLNIDHMHPKKFFENEKNLKSQLREEMASRKRCNSFCKKIDKLQKVANSLVNLELLEKKPNQEKLATPLKKWIEKKLPKYGKKFDYRKNFITNTTPLDLKNCEKFFKVRRENMYKCLENFFKGKQCTKI